MIAIETTCRTCGRTFTPTPDDIRRGLWRRCPPCRDGPPLEPVVIHMPADAADQADEPDERTPSMKTFQERYDANPFKGKGLDAQYLLQLETNYNAHGISANSWPDAQTVEGSGAWVAVYPRPTRQDSPDLTPVLVERRQAQWDAAEVKFLSSLEAHVELRKKREARQTAEQATRDAERAAYDAHNLDELTVKLRRGFMTIPGSTEEEFQRALPDLLLKARTRAALDGVRETKSPISLSEIWNGDLGAA